MIVIVIALVLLLSIVALATLSGGQPNNRQKKDLLDEGLSMHTNDWMPLQELPIDVKRRLERDFPDPDERASAETTLINACAKRLNVGNEQFVRALMVMAAGDLEALKTYANGDDPRDVVFWATEKAGYKNDSMTLPFPD